MAKKPRRILPRMGKPTKALREQRVSDRQGRHIYIIETTSDDPGRLDFVYTLGSLDGLKAHTKRVGEGRTNPRHLVSLWKQLNNHPDGGELLDRYTLEG